MDKNAKIYVAGHNGMVGSAILQLLRKQGYSHIITRTLKELDLRNQAQVYHFFEQEKPEYVFLAAAKVGGILANSQFPAHFIYDNLAIQINVVDAAYKYKVKKLLFLGSSCIYPSKCAQPIKEEYLLNGYLENTNAPYAIAKIAGITLCQAYNKQFGTLFITCMPTNLYGPRDNFDLETSHVIPALIRKFIEAQQEKKKEVYVWGTGAVWREFLFVEDLADACLFLMNHYHDNEIINIGTGIDILIKDLAERIKLLVQYNGTIIFDTSKPEGTYRKVLNIDKLVTLGWRALTPLDQGLVKTIAWYTQHKLCG